MAPLFYKFHSHQINIDMIYQVEDNTVLFELDRRKIADISPGDILKTSSFPGEYIWTEHDAQFVESNPEAHLFLKIRKESGDEFQGLGIVVIPEE
jgi:hypothetical protein